MEKFYKRKKFDSGSGEGGSSARSTSVQQSHSIVATVTSKPFVDLNSLPSDPAERKSMSEFHPDQIDEIRRAYMLKGPCQPRDHSFPQSLFGNKWRRFNPAWFDEYGNWLEYSIKEDKAYCLICYLFREQISKKGGGGAFVTEGFCQWSKKKRLDTHVGGVDSAHNFALQKYNDLLRQEKSIPVAVRLCASIDSCRFLLRQGLPFHGHDESDDSSNRGNFLELIKLIAEQNDFVRNVVFGNAPQNSQMIAPAIHKDIVHCFAQEIVKRIIADFEDDIFSLLLDESSDVFGKEQMVVVVRFVDSRGNVKERFIGVVQVKEISALNLKSAVDNLFADLGLSLMKIRGQGYDGASNMKDEFDGLKTLIMNENRSAYYIHCFAHELQSTLVGVAKNHNDISTFFYMISSLVNVVGASCKRQDMIQQKLLEKLLEGIQNGLIETGKGLNQEISLKRAVDTQWGSDYKSLLNLVSLFSSVVEVLQIILGEAQDTSKRAQARNLLGYLDSFDFVFCLHLMVIILGITNPLSLALQRKDGDILNAMSLVRLCRMRLQQLRDDGWESLLSDINKFCNANNIDFLDMTEEYVNRYFPRRKTHITNDFHYRVGCFYTIVDKQILELNDRFNEVNSELLRCVACLNPSDEFSDFNVASLMRLAQFYPYDFDSGLDYNDLQRQLELYILDMRSDARFSQLTGLSDLSTLLVQTRKHLSYPLVYLLLKLALILPLATASVERCFSAMNIVKMDLQNRICDSFLNDCLVCFIEKDLLLNITNSDVIERLYENA